MPQHATGQISSEKSPRFRSLENSPCRSPVACSIPLQSPWRTHPEQSPGEIQGQSPSPWPECPLSSLRPSTAGCRASQMARLVRVSIIHVVWAAARADGKYTLFEMRTFDQSFRSVYRRPGCDIDQLYDRCENLRIISTTVDLVVQHYFQPTPGCRQGRASTVWFFDAALRIPWRGPASPGAGSLHGRRRAAGRPATAGAGRGRRRKKRRKRE